MKQTETKTTLDAENQELEKNVINENMIWSAIKGLNTLSDKQIVINSRQNTINSQQNSINSYQNSVNSLIEENIGILLSRNDRIEKQLVAAGEKIKKLKKVIFYQFIAIAVTVGAICLHLFNIL